jgi:ribonuclease III
MDFHAFEQSLGLTFNNKALLQQAFTHSSHVNEQDDVVAHSDNERLEFLGDAVLDFVAGDLLFRRFPDLPEGALTQLRTAIVRMEALAEQANQLKMGPLLRLGKGEERAGGRTRPTNLCRAFEALIGAIYVDQGLEVVKTFVTPRLLTYLDQVKEAALAKDARSQLQEYIQLNYNITPQFKRAEAVGPDHAKQHLVHVVVGDVTLGEGYGSSVRAAGQAAAQDALTHLDRLPPPTTRQTKHAPKS